MSATTIDKDNYILEQFHFKGDYEGLFTWDKQYKNVQAAVNDFGEDTVLGLVNTALKSQLRNKAKAVIGQHDTKEEFAAAVNQRVNSNPELLSTDEVERFVPGEREKSTQALLKEANTMAKEAKKYASADPDYASQCNEKRKALLKEAREKLMAELDSE